MKITQISAYDLRFELGRAGSDALHHDPAYSFATCVLRTGEGAEGTGITLTLGRGNELVTQAIGALAPFVLGVDVLSAVRDLGALTARWSNESQLRWVGPHKGVIHLALASVLGAIVDLWATSSGKPLWRVLLDQSPEEIADLVDFSAVDDFLTRDEALAMLRNRRLPPAEIDAQIARGYPAYDTSVGWLGYSEDELRRTSTAAVEAGFGAVKVKVGLDDLAADLRRVGIVRERVGPDRLLMIDANQRWGVAGAIEAGRALAEFDPFWFEEPVHPDDVLGYRDVSQALAPLRIAGGEHVSNPVLFKNFIRAEALQVVQPDAVRLAGLSEYLAVALMSAKAGLPALPHVGDMGQLHQHLIVFTRCALGMPELPLELIPHLAEHFVDPVTVRDGAYVLPDQPGAGTALRPDSILRSCRWARSWEMA